MNIPKDLVGSLEALGKRVELIDAEREMAGSFQVTAYNMPDGSRKAIAPARFADVEVLVIDHIGAAQPDVMAIVFAIAGNIDEHRAAFPNLESVLFI